MFHFSKFQLVFGAAQNKKLNHNLYKKLYITFISVMFDDRVVNIKQFLQPLLAKVPQKGKLFTNIAELCEEWPVRLDLSNDG